MVEYCGEYTSGVHNIGRMLEYTGGVPVIWYRLEYTVWIHNQFKERICLHRSFVRLTSFVKQ